MKGKLLLVISFVCALFLCSCSDDNDETYYSGEYGKMTPYLSFDTILGSQKGIVIDTITVDTTGGISYSCIAYHFIEYRKDNVSERGVYSVSISHHHFDAYAPISWSDTYKNWTLQIHKLYYNNETNKVNGFTYTIKERKN